LICTGAVADYECGGTGSGGPPVDMMTAAAAGNGAPAAAAPAAASAVATERKSQLHSTTNDVIGELPREGDSDAPEKNGSRQFADEENKSTAPESNLSTAEVTLDPNAENTLENGVPATDASEMAAGSEMKASENEGSAIANLPSSSSDNKGSESGQPSSRPETAPSSLASLAVVDSFMNARPLWSLTPVRCCLFVG